MVKGRSPRGESLPPSRLNPRPVPSFFKITVLGAPLGTSTNFRSAGKKLCQLDYSTSSWRHHTWQKWFTVKGALENFGWTPTVDVIIGRIVRPIVGALCRSYRPTSRQDQNNLRSRGLQIKAITDVKRSSKGNSKEKLAKNKQTQMKRCFFNSKQKRKWAKVTQKEWIYLISNQCLKR